MAHVKLNRRTSREEGASQDLGMGQVIGLCGAAALAVGAGSVIGTRSADDAYSKVKRWWNDEDKNGNRSGK